MKKNHTNQKLKGEKKTNKKAKGKKQQKKENTHTQKNPHITRKRNT